MTPEIVTYERTADLQRIRRNEYAREYYRKNRRKINAQAKRRRNSKLAKAIESHPEPTKQPWYLVVPHSDSLLSNIRMSLRVAWKLIVTGPTETEQ
jgi:hypothetical protein